MKKYEPLIILPQDIQYDFMARLDRCYDTEDGAFRLVDIKTTEGQSAMGQRISVMVLDENGFPVPNVQVAFSFDTANQYILLQEYEWVPPYPHRAFLARTDGGGMCDMVLGAEGVVKKGQPGGVTCYVMEQEYSSDAVSGLGMLGDHTGLFLIFQLRRLGVVPLAERLESLDARLSVIEAYLQDVV